MSTTSSRRSRRVLLTVAVLAVLAAVGGTLASGVLGEDRAADTAGRTPVTEVDLRAPARLPVLPAAASQPTEAGATAFALFWFDTLNYSLARLDSDALVAYTGAGCGQCNGWLVAISRWKTSGSTLEGGLTVPLNLAIGPFTKGEPVQLSADYLTNPATVVDSTGKGADYPGGRTRGGLTVIFANGRWQMTDVVLDATTAGARP